MYNWLLWRRAQGGHRDWFEALHSRLLFGPRKGKGAL